MVEDAKLGGGHVGVAHELLGEHLAGLDLRRLPRRAKDAQARFLEKVNDAARQGLFRADHRQGDVFFLGELDQRVEVVDVDGSSDCHPDRFAVKQDEAYFSLFVSVHPRAGSPPRRR